MRARSKVTVLANHPPAIQPASPSATWERSACRPCGASSPPLGPAAISPFPPAHDCCVGIPPGLATWKREKGKAGSRPFSTRDVRPTCTDKAIPRPGCPDKPLSILLLAKVPPVPISASCRCREPCPGLEAPPPSLAGCSQGWTQLPHPTGCPPRHRVLVTSVTLTGLPGVRPKLHNFPAV